MSDEIVEQATMLNGCEAPPGNRGDGIETRRNHYRRLAIANSLDWNGKWRDEGRATIKDNLAIVNAIGSQLELTSYQKQRSEVLFESLPKELYGAYESALLALCVCGIAAREDGRDYHPNNAHPNSDTDTEFTAIFDEISAGYKQLYSCWERVQGEVQ
jgi:hypothetical protein